MTTLAKVFPAEPSPSLLGCASRRGDVLAGNTVLYGATSGQLFIAAAPENASLSGTAVPLPWSKASASTVAST